MCVPESRPKWINQISAESAKLYLGRLIRFQIFTSSPSPRLSFPRIPLLFWLTPDVLFFVLFFVTGTGPGL